MKEKNSARFFLALQEAPWYRAFLAPVTEQLRQMPEGSKILDVGCGPGKLMEEVLLHRQQRFTGVDTNREMLVAAAARPMLKETRLLTVYPATRLPFEDGYFDAVVFCSLLFLLEEPRFLLEEALRLLVPGGRVFILNPTGKTGLMRPWRSLLHPANGGFWLWRRATRGRGRKWSSALPAEKLAAERGLIHEKRPVFYGLALLETLERGSLA